MDGKLDRVEETLIDGIDNNLEDKIKEGSNKDPIVYLEHRITDGF